MHRFRHTIAKTCLLLSALYVLVGATVFASPYGAGLYGENVPYGGETSLTIATSGNISIPVTPSDAGTLASGTSTVTVTSSDVIGFKLYIRAKTATPLDNGNGSTVPASANGAPAALAVNTWGYNTDGSSNYVGITLSDVLIRNATDPYTSGDVTSVKYGVKVDNTKPAGNYTTTVVYTAVPQTQ